MNYGYASYGYGAARGGAPLPVPALDLNFLSSEVLDPRIGASGGVGGTRVNSAGTIVAAAAPRYDYDPATLAARGLLIEEARTNLFTSAAVGGAGLISQSVTVTAVPHTISFYGTGTITLSGASAAGPIVGTADYPAPRTSLTFTPSAGTLICSVSGSVRWAQCEAGAFATSFIPSGGSPTPRTADAALLAGANFSSWFNPVEGSFAVGADVRAIVANPGANLIWQADDGTGNNRITGLVWLNLNDNWMLVAGAHQISGIAGVAPVVGTPFGASLGYKLNNVGASMNGAAALLDTSATIPAGLNALRLGSDGGNWLNGHLRRLRYYASRLTDAQLQKASV